MCGINVTLRYLFAIQHGRSIDDANDLLDQLGVLPLGVPDE